MSCVEYRHNPKTGEVQSIGLTLRCSPVEGLRVVVGSVLDREGREVHGITLRPTSELLQPDVWDEASRWLEEHVRAILQPTLYP